MPSSSSSSARTSRRIWAGGCSPSELLRYAFVAAGWVLPWMAATLPPRYWRKVVTAVAGIGLTIAASGLHAPGVPTSS